MMKIVSANPNSNELIQLQVRHTVCNELAKFAGSEHQAAGLLHDKNAFDDLEHLVTGCIKYCKEHQVNTIDENPVIIHRTVIFENQRLG